MSYTPLFMSSANALMDLVSDKSSFFTTMFWFPESCINSSLAASAFARSRQAMMTRAPEDITEKLIEMCFQSQNRADILHASEIIVFTYCSKRPCCEMSLHNN